MSIPQEVKDARDILWRKGILTWKLDSFQKGIVEELKNNTDNLPVILSSRRSGKSVYLTVIAMEQCLQHPGSIVKILQPEQKQLKMNMKPIMNMLLDDCPSDVKPSFKSQDNIWVFPNGSEIHLAGSDNGNNEKLRGANAHLAIIDEAGFCNDLRYTIQSILLPMTLLTKGKIILSSTPPKSMEHEFVPYIKQAELRGNLIKKTIFDVKEACAIDSEPRITQTEIDIILESYPLGVNDEEFRREYMCELIKNGDTAVIPEATDLLMEDIVTEWMRPVICDKYVSMDIGFKDLTVVLFGYYDFDSAVLVIEDEIVMSGSKMLLSDLAEKIKKKEAELWTNSMTGEVEEPHKRLSDNNLIVINELHKKYGVKFTVTEKENKSEHINAFRIDISNHRVIINPRCKVLIHHIQNAEWNKARTKFLRSADAGHYDAVDAILYMNRGVNKNRNPYPRGYGGPTGGSVFRKYDDKSDDRFAGLINALTRRRR